MRGPLTPAEIAELNYKGPGYGLGTRKAELLSGEDTIEHAHVLAKGATDVTATAAQVNELVDGADTSLHTHDLEHGASDVTATADEINQALDGIAAEVTAAGLSSISQQAVKFPGLNALGVLRVASDVADGQLVEIGADVYEVDIINTDSGDDTAGGSWNNVTNPLTVDLAGAGYANLRGAVIVGDLIRVGNEIMKVTAIAGTLHTFARGRCGTTAAAHLNAQDIFHSDAPGMTNIPVGLVVTLTPTVYTAALAPEINAENTEGVRATRISANEVLVHLMDAAATQLDLAESLAGANNAWDTAATRGGAAAALPRLARASRVPNAQEVALGNLHVVLPFEPAAVIVQVRVTASGAVKAWDGNTVVSGSRVTLTNTGGTNWAQTDTIHVIAME